MFSFFEVHITDNPEHWGLCIVVVAACLLLLIVFDLSLRADFCFLCCSFPQAAAACAALCRDRVAVGRWGSASCTACPCDPDLYMCSVLSDAHPTSAHSERAERERAEAGRSGGVRRIAIGCVSPG